VGNENQVNGMNITSLGFAFTFLPAAL